ncbi:MAG: hypothetical protein U1A78_25050 [Polyangia bacterium]
MSGEGDSAPARRVLIGPLDHGTEIAVLGADQRELAAGYCTLEVSLVPGIYKFRVRAGTAVRDVLCSIEPGDTPLVLTELGVLIPSPIPVPGTRYANPDQLAIADRLATADALNEGEGGALFIFVRDQGDRPEAGAAYPANPAEGLSIQLESSTGPRSIALGEHASVTGSGSAGVCAGRNVHLRPGRHRLRFDAAADGTFELSAVVCAGWQTLVFVPIDFSGDAPRPGLAEAALFMRPLDETGTLAERAAVVRAGEIARMNLVRRRPVITAEDVERLVVGRLLDPLQAICGAHLLLLAPEPDKPRIAAIVAKLKEAVPDHPDVAALSLRLGDTPAGSFAAPPMFVASWDLIVRAASTEHALIPPGSLSEYCATHLWGDGAYVLWHSPPDETWAVSGNTTRALRTLRTLDDARRAARRLVAEDGELAERARGSSLSPWENALLDHLIADNETSADELARSLRVPRSALDSISATLATKLDE